jgi:hypothetical protein
MGLRRFFKARNMPSDPLGRIRSAFFSDKNLGMKRAQKNSGAWKEPRYQNDLRRFHFDFPVRKRTPKPNGPLEYRGLLLAL